MRRIYIAMLLLALVAVVGHYVYTMQQGAQQETAPVTEQTEQEEHFEEKVLPIVVPIEHASFVLNWDGLVIYNDPVGGAELYADQLPANVVLISDVHGDHLDADTISAVLGSETLLIVPPAVADELPEELAERALVLKNGDTLVDDLYDFRLTAIPMYNLPEQELETVYHEEGRGNGYLVERSGARVYIAGDTADTPEMRAMEAVDVAFVPMNLPYTMSVEDAAAGVAAFAPAQVYPYHYRGIDGLADVAQFAELLAANAPEVEVVQLDWYPEQPEVDVAEE